MLPGAAIRLERATGFLEEDLAPEFAQGYLKPLQVDAQVGLIAVVGEGMRGTPGLAIAIVVNRAGPEQAVGAVHEECGLGKVNPVT